MDPSERLKCAKNNTYHGYKFFFLFFVHFFVWTVCVLAIFIIIIIVRLFLRVNGWRFNQVINELICILIRNGLGGMYWFLCLDISSKSLNSRGYRLIEKRLLLLVVQLFYAVLHSPVLCMLPKFLFVSLSNCSWFLSDFFGLMSLAERNFWPCGHQTLHSTQFLQRVPRHSFSREEHYCRFMATLLVSLLNLGRKERTSS